MAIILTAVWFLMCMALPLKALAECKAVESTPLQRCGMLCVIETIVCDTKEAAELEAVGRHKAEVWQPKGSEKWLLNYYATEAEANAL